MADDASDRSPHGVAVALAALAEAVKAIPGLATSMASLATQLAEMRGQVMAELRAGAARMDSIDRRLEAQTERDGAVRQMTDRHDVQIRGLVDSQEEAKSQANASEQVRQQGKWTLAALAFNALWSAVLTWWTLHTHN